MLSGGDCGGTPPLGRAMNDGAVICIVLVAGVDSQVEREILERHDLAELHGLPRALLPVGGMSILDHWNAAIIEQREIESVYIVSSGAKFKHFERWASSHGIPVNHVVNNGVCDSDLSRGAASDMLLGMNRALQHRVRSGGGDGGSFLVLGGDTLFYEGFDLSGPLSFYKTVPATSLCLGYTPGQDEDLTRRGIITVDRRSRLVSTFVEKPSADDATLRDAASDALCVPVFYMFRTSVISHCEKFIAERVGVPLGAQRGRAFSCGTFLEWLHRAQSGAGAQPPLLPGDTDARRRALQPSAPLSMYAMRLPGSFGLACGDLCEYESLNARWGGHASAARRVQKRCFARAGLIGNPSDGFHGKTVSLTVANFWADVTLTQSERLELKPHPLCVSTHWCHALVYARSLECTTLWPALSIFVRVRHSFPPPVPSLSGRPTHTHSLPHSLICESSFALLRFLSYDPLSFGGLGDLHGIGKREGYQGGMVLLMATCKKFYEYCMERGIALHKRNFTLQYDTNIPRQVGMSGSSAIVTAAFKALMDFYSITESDILPIDQVRVHVILYR